MIHEIKSTQEGAQRKGILTVKVKFDSKQGSKNTRVVRGEGLSIPPSQQTEVEVIDVELCGNKVT